jgi:hypothetical protein
MRALARILPLGLVAALAAAVLAGCGGVRLDPVAEAATSTADAGSFRFSYTLTAALGDAQTPDASTGTGTYDAQSRRLALSFDAGGGRIHVVADLAAKRALYVRLPSQERWLKLDVDRMPGLYGLDLGDLSPSHWSAQELLSSLKQVGDSTKVGEEELDGVSTTHYRVEVDPKKLIEKQPDAPRQSAEKALEKSGIETVPVDVWVGDDGLLRRISLNVDGGASTPFSLKARLDLTDYGSDVHVDLPPADQVLGG